MTDSPGLGQSADGPRAEGRGDLLARVEVGQEATLLSEQDVAAEGLDDSLSLLVQEVMDDVGSEDRKELNTSRQPLNVFELRQLLVQGKVDPLMREKRASEGELR